MYRPFTNQSAGVGLGAVTAMVPDAPSSCAVLGVLGHIPQQAVLITKAEHGNSALSQIATDIAILKDGNDR